MSIAKSFFLFFILFLSAPLYAKPNVCVFALNAESESQEFKNFFSKHDLNVNYYAPVKKSEKSIYNPITEQFKNFVDKMVSSENPQNCDLMTISGHHSGEFWGENVEGRLNLKEIYKMSCNPKYAEFFNNIKGWWLLGCQTDGLNIKSAEEEAARLLRECDRDENPEYCDYSRNLITYGALYDKDAPYLSSLQSISPKSYMFAYTKKAPLSPKSLKTFQRQFEKTGTILSQELNNSIQTTQLPSHVTSINSIVSRLMNPTLDACKNCSEVGDEQFEAAVIKGWNEHEGEYYSPNALAPVDRSAKACSKKGQALLSRDVLTRLPAQELVRCHHDIDCMLLNQIEGLQCIKNNEPGCANKFNLDTTKKILDIITNPDNKEAYSLFAKSFNNVESLIRELKAVKPSQWQSQVKPILQKNYQAPNSLLKAFFDNKIDPPIEVKRDPDFAETAALRKMAIYSVEKAILEGSSEESKVRAHRQVIDRQVRSLLTDPDLKAEEFNDYRQELVRAQYYYELKDINTINSDNLPPGVRVEEGRLTIIDPSQMVGMVEHLSHRNQQNLSERQRQQSLYKLISEVSSSELSKLNNKQKVDYFNAYQSIYDEDLVRLRNQSFMNQSDSKSVWGMSAFLDTASKQQIETVLKKLRPQQLNSEERSVLLESFAYLNTNSSEVARVVEGVQSPDLYSAEDAYIFKAIEQSDADKFNTYLYLQDKLINKKYTKADMTTGIESLNQRPSEEFRLLVNYLALTKDYDQQYDSCQLINLYKRKYRKLGVDTASVRVDGC